MKLGVFDSGLGGLFIAKAIRAKMPDIDMLYFGDTLHLPYGGRSAEAIYEYTRRAVDAMFAQDCQLIVLACNTASAFALRRLQQEYLPLAWPGRNVLGVVVPTLEEVAGQGDVSKKEQRIGMIATPATVRAGVYEQELAKLCPEADFFAVPTPLLVPLIEQPEGAAWLEDVLLHYLAPLQAAGIDRLIMGCTHYIRLRPLFEKLNFNFNIFYQDIVISDKLYAYLKRHPEYDQPIARSGCTSFYVSDLTGGYQQNASHLWGEDINVKVLKS